MIKSTGYLQTAYGVWVEGNFSHVFVCSQGGSVSSQRGCLVGGESDLLPPRDGYWHDRCASYWSAFLLNLCIVFIQTGCEDWFLLTTRESLGELKTLDVWLDFTGLYPSW